MGGLGAPVAGDDLLTPFLDRVPPAVGERSVPGKRPRYEPRNMDFADGLDRWNLEVPEGYVASVEGQSATLASAASRPAGSALLLQEIYAEDYRGGAVTFSGEIRTGHLTAQAGLRLLVFGSPPDGWRGGPVREDRGVTVSGRTKWTRHEVTALVPGDASMIVFGIGSPAPAWSRCGIRALGPGRNAMSSGISDGDLVRLARDGDAVAFRLLVERHLPMARARARRLCANPSDVDNIVQESFLQAFLALDRLREPDRFPGWLAGIVLNACRALRRGPRVALLPDWPEPLHPAATDGQPSAEDLDRADALRAAVASLPAGQRHAVALHYYADLQGARAGRPRRGQGQPAQGPAAATRLPQRASPRSRLRQEDPHDRCFVARVERRIPPGPIPDRNHTHVLVLADDAGHRELPILLLVWHNGVRISAAFKDRNTGTPEPSGTPERRPAPPRNSPASCCMPPGPG